MTTVLVTGASGFLGSHLVRELLNRHYRVRAFVRPRPSGSPPMMLTGLPIEYAEGDISQPTALTEAARGCQAIIHAAALARVNPARDPALWSVNLTGTENVLRAAQKVGIQRLVYVGTANAFGFGTRQQPGDETRPFAGARYGLDYMDSKRAATERVERAVQTEGLPAVLVHPTFMLGPCDTKPTSGAMLLVLYRGGLIGYPAGGKNYVHVRDVATATVNALTRGQIGESYILGNQNMSYREAFGLMARVMAVAPPRLPLPAALTRLFGYGCDAWTKLTGRRAQLNSGMAAVACDGHYFSVQKAIQALDLPQTPIETAVRDAFDWFIENNYVPKRPPYRT